MFDLVVANYNNAAYLPNFLSSIERSTMPPQNIIFVDDCSTDNSLEVLESCLEQSSLTLKLVLNSQNLGFAYSLNKALALTESDFIARLDPDDYVHEHRFEKQFDYLRNNPQFCAVGTNVTYVMGDAIIGQSAVPVNEEIIKAKVKSGFLPLIHGSAMFRRSALQHFRYKKELVPAEDYDLFAFLIYKNGRLANLPESLTFVNIHANSVSNSLKFSTVMKRYNTCYNYFCNYKPTLLRYFEYIHQKNYRRFLFSTDFRRYYFLFLSILVNPLKLYRRLRP